MHEVCCCFKSLWVDFTGIMLMDDKASEIKLSRTGVILLFSDRDLDETNPMSLQRVTVMTKVLDTSMLLKGHAPVIEGGRFPHISKSST